ncbi:hypothetical protein RIF29_24762 [Crotalaria pallida]|uniref:CCHC-type domain-containing protein n=1 Tax=Crotalaria pallida TaxID=3830 RepID=A0AAN9HWW7_CROPI
MLANTTGEHRWYWLQYKRLPNFCYNCGILGHGEKDCENELVKGEKMYGEWLQTTYGEKMLSQEIKTIDEENPKPNPTPQGTDPNKSVLDKVIMIPDNVDEENMLKLGTKLIYQTWRQHVRKN